MGAALVLDPCRAEYTKHTAHMALALMPTRNLVRTRVHRAPATVLTLATLAGNAAALHWYMG